MAKRIYEIDGEQRSLTEWCRVYGIDRRTVSNRLFRGMPLVEALTTPAVHKLPERHLSKQEKIWKVCNECQWSELADNHPACFYIDYPGHGRRPVPAEVCIEKGEDSVFEPRKKGRWTPAQEIAFMERGFR